MKVIHKHTIYLDRVQSNIYIDVMQGDANTRVLELSLYAGGVAWNVPDGAHVAVAYGGASGRGIYDTLPDGTAACAVDGNVVTAVVAPQALSAPGYTKLTVVFTDGNGHQLAAFCVTLNVEYNPAVGATNPPDYINLRQWMNAELSVLLEELGVNNDFIFEVVGDVNTDATMADILAAEEAGRTVYCSLETDGQIMITLPKVKDDHGIYYFSAVCEGVEYLVTISQDDAGNTVTTVEQSEVGSGGNIDCLPQYSEADNGKVLGIVDGSPAWVEATVSGGDTPVVPGTHGVVWDLVNVTSSNTAVSVADGASLVAVLTAADGYTLGDVIVTMGGEVLTGVWNADTATITIASATGDVVISCVGVEQTEQVTETLVHEFKDYVNGEWTDTSSTDQYSVFMYPEMFGGVYSFDWNTEECSSISFGMYTYDADGIQTGRLRFANFAGSGDCGEVEFVPIEGTTKPNVPYSEATGPFSFRVPDGYRCAIWVKRGTGTGTKVSSNTTFTTWVHTGVTATVTNIPVDTSTANAEEPTVMMASFDRVYTDTGVYTEDLTPKWDGMFSIHRGMSTAPNNTLQAIWEAKKHGYNCCELDVRYTSDNQVVLCHDATVTGTVDGEEVTYAIAETPLATLQAVCIGNTAFPDAKICSLEDAMRLCRRIGMRPEIDYKVLTEQLYNDCVALSMKYGLQDDTLHACYGINYAVAVKTAYEKANLRVSGELLSEDTTLDVYLSKPGNMYAYYSAAYCGKTDGSNVGNNTYNEGWIYSNKARGYKMYVWGVTPYLLPDVMQWEPDILQLQSSKDGSDWYTLIRELNIFDGLVW